MEIQKNISATVKKKLKENLKQAEFAHELGVGHTTFQTCLAGRGNPDADTIELLAKGMGVTLVQLASWAVEPADRAFDTISSMVDALHPTLQEAGAILLDALRHLFRLSEERYANDVG